MSGIGNGSSDDTKQATRRRSGDRINVQQEVDVRDWSRSLGVSTAKLRVAVAAVGDQADKVEEYLEKH